MADKENLLNVDKEASVDATESKKVTIRESNEGKTSKNKEKLPKDKENAKSKNQKSDKPGFFAKLAKKFKGLKSEFKKITWANVRTTFKNFGIVLVGLIIFGAAIGLVDLGLGSLFKWLLSL